MAVPKDWSAQYGLTNNQLVIADPRAICPHCRNAATFTIRSYFAITGPALSEAHAVMQCNYGSCKKIVYVYTGLRAGQLTQRPDDPFFMSPSLAISAPHPAVPTPIAEDFAEAQRAMQASAPKAAAVMLRRVLYGVLIDKGCKLRPLHEGLAELISAQRLPAIFDEWLPAIKDDGHDGAHPDRALQVSSDNIIETMDYTSELLRFLYVEPYEFQQRKIRNAASSCADGTP